ncbi:ATP-binding protein [Pseudarthrobacter sp. J47]|uniref:ATP-binding protein n=1 Tax=Pseudarthrobacter sp. J47 TaxID=3116482 RepID=UPI002E8182E3|nr:ATP-binding protein [Pseudarthrobacter sp. J47]MEE2524493.1 ATP-binding protein [Pseudarthrobacter sp. J47]
MKLSRWLLNNVGLGDQRLKPPPHYEAISDGLLVTATKAEAWLTIETSNTDHVSNEEILENLDAVIAEAGNILEGSQCHLKVVWGRISGEDYRESAADLTDGGSGDGTMVFDERADRIDYLEMPERHVLLGVQIVDREHETVAEVKRTAEDWAGLGKNTVTEAQLLGYFGLARQLQQALSNTRWAAKLASAEQISWAIGRESHRDKEVVKRRGFIRGAQLFDLTSSKIIPHEDFLEFKGNMGETVAYGSVIALSDFPEEMRVPGDGEWLKTLSRITRIDQSEDERLAGRPVPVIVDASVRFRVMSKGEARKRAEEARKTAKEQRRSASKNSAGETPPDVAEAEELAEAAVNEIQHGGMRLVESHPRLIVKGRDLDELDANVQAVVSYYAGIGVRAVVGVDEQRDLFLESLMGDSLRIVDLGHIQDDVQFFGSFFWGGSKVGDSVGPVAGYLTGSTPGVFRSNIARAASLGIATTSCYVGKSGMGKTVSICLDMLNAATLGPSAFNKPERLEELVAKGLDLNGYGVWQVLLDTKGDVSGLVGAARRYGINSELLRVTERYEGAADLFLSLDDPFEAATVVAGQLVLLAPANLRGIADEAALEAATVIAGQPHPTTHAVIELLQQSENEDTQKFGRYLSNLAQLPLGKLTLGKPNGRQIFHEEPGIWVYQFPGLQLPADTQHVDVWTPIQKLSMAVLRGFLSNTVKMTSKQRLRFMPKVVAIPEVHHLLKVGDGVAFLDSLARVGRANNASLLLDSQDAQGISMIPGIVEQLSSVRIFQLTSQPEVDAAAALLQKDPASIGPTIRNLAVDPNAPDGLRKGHCLAMDYRGRVGTVQYDFPNSEGTAEGLVDSWG